MPAGERAGGADGRCWRCGRRRSRSTAGRPDRRQRGCAARCWTWSSPATARPIASRSASRSMTLFQQNLAPRRPLAPGTDVDPVLVARSSCAGDTVNRLFGPIPASRALHIVVDMQELFRSPPGLGHASADRHRSADPAPAGEPSRTNAYFTRFIPAQRADQAEGTWQRYYHRWHSVTLDAARSRPCRPGA